VGEGRKYKNTHPWITFELDMKKAHPRLWILLGRAVEGCKQLRNARINPNFAENMILESRLRGIYGTTVIEGNTLSYNDINEINSVQRIDIKNEIEKVHERAEKEYDGRDKRFTINALRLFIFLKEKTEELGINWDLDIKAIKGLHQVLYSGIVKKTDTLPPGEIRKRSIRVGGYIGVPHEECIYLMNRLTKGLADIKDKFPAEDEIVSGIVRAFLAHKYIAWIQPFEMGNCITARFVELQLMLSAGVPPAAAFCQSAYYNRTHKEYSDILYGEKKGIENVMLFIEYGLRGFLSELKRLIEEINTSQEEAVWKNCLDSVLEENKSRIARRQQNLLLDIVKIGGSVPASDVRYISPRLTEAYAGKSLKTAVRDIQSLIDYGFLSKHEKVLTVRRQMIYPFKKGKPRGKNEF